MHIAMISYKTNSNRVISQRVFMINYPVKSKCYHSVGEFRPDWHSYCFISLIGEYERAAVEDP